MSGKAAQRDLATIGRLQGCLASGIFCQVQSGSVHKFWQRAPHDFCGDGKQILSTHVVRHHHSHEGTPVINGLSRTERYLLMQCPLVSTLQPLGKKTGRMRGGLSFDRMDGRPSSACIEFLRSHVKYKGGGSGSVMSLSVDDCEAAGSCLKYRPSPDNAFHTELWGSEDRALLELEQRKTLAALATVEEDVPT